MSIETQPQPDVKEVLKIPLSVSPWSVDRFTLQSFLTSFLHFSQLHNNQLN